MFKPIASAIGALLVASPVSAAWTNQNGVKILESQDFPLTHRPLFNALAAVNINVVDGYDWEQCAVGDQYYTAGFYVPAHNFIVLCTNSPAPDILSTFTHEAVHAVQDCRAGLDNSILHHGVQNHMVDALGGDELDLIRSAYPENEWLDEVEARYFADSPSVVTTGVQRFCF
ncbi:MAG: hypothetical protein GY914_10350 [Prochlorococcus sp.]|nr:hypothetical protein [Prochlorococcus sp.]